MWSRDAPEAAEVALRALLSKLRGVLGVPVTRGRSVVEVLLGDVSLDIERLRDEVAAAEAAERADPAGASRRAAAALDIVAGGRVAPEFEAEWLDDVRREVDDCTDRALGLIARVALAGDATEAGVRAARELVHRNPLSENAQLLLIGLLAASGEVPAALEAYDAFRAWLMEELGAIPGRELRALHRRLVADDASSAAGGPTMPAALTGRLSGSFVGRTQLRDAIRRSLSATAAGPSWIFIRGEPGIGKSTLLAHLGHELLQAGWVVAYGRSDRERLVPYQPLVETLRYLVAGGHVPPAPADGRHELARLLPELQPDVDRREQPGGGSTRDGRDRRRLAELVIEWLGAIVRQTRLLLMLDDLQWIDSGTLALLCLFRRRPELRGLTVLGSFREAEVDERHPLAAVVGEARHQDAGREFLVQGLDLEACAQLVAAESAGTPSAEAVAELWSQTRGNPLFAKEVLRDLHDRGLDLDHARPLERTLSEHVPEGVAEVVAQRLARLPERAVGLLEIAAVAVPDIELELVAAAARMDLDDADDDLALAVATQLLDDRNGPPGRFEFTHALVHAAVLERVSRTRRNRIHARLARAAERQARARDWPPGAHARLARHLLAAGELGDVEKAVEAATAAAADAAAQFAWEEAAATLRDALSLLARARPHASLRRLELMLSLGALEARAGERERSRTTFAAGADLAREIGDPSAFARAALGFGGEFGEGGVVDRELVALLEEALARVGDADPSLRVRLLARLANELYFADGEVLRRRMLSGEAISLAGAVADLRTRMAALTARYMALWVPGSDDAERLAVADELVKTGELSDDPEDVLQGLDLRLGALLTLGRGDEAARDVAEFGRRAARLRSPLYLWLADVFAATHHQLRGEADAAEQAAERARSRGMTVRPQTAEQYHATLLWALRRDQGRGEECESFVAAMVERYPGVPSWQGILAALHLDAGDVRRAEAEYRPLAETRFAAIRPDRNWLTGLALLAEVAAATADLAGCRMLHERLLPARGLTVVPGRGGIAFLGSVARPLALLAHALGDVERAVAHLGEAERIESAMGARPALRRTAEIRRRVGIAAPAGG